MFKKDFDFIGKSTIAFILSVLLIVGSVGLLFTKGLNFGIDFTGGIVIEFRHSEEVELSALRPVLPSDEFGEITLQHLEKNEDVMLRLQAQEGVERAVTIERAKERLNEVLGAELDFRKVDYVGPQVGRELISNGALSLLFAFAAIMAYIWMRFEWQFSVGAIVALIHDVVIILGVYSALQLEFNLTSVAAVLIIIGYSINDSVVIYDRIRDNLRKYKKKPLAEVLNMSVNANLARTLLTSGTTLLSVMALVILGGDVLYGFSVAVLCGIVVGTYSSIYIASSLLLPLGVRKRKVHVENDGAGISDDTQSA